MSLGRGKRLRRNTAMQEAGLPPLPAAKRVEPVKLDVGRESPERLRQAKIQRLNQLMNAEPPRETITGSFRSH